MKKLKAKRVVMRDDDGHPVGHGDKIRFSFGIPPVVVVADVIDRGDGKLIALTPGHNPPECPLRSLRRYVGAWFNISIMARTDRGQNVQVDLPPKESGDSTSDVIGG